MSVYNVTIPDNAGVGTLRWAIGEANLNPGSTIVIQASLPPIVITGNQMNITASVTINGNNNIVRQAINNRSLFTINTVNAVIFNDMIMERDPANYANTAPIIITESNADFNNCIMRNFNPFNNSFFSGGAINATNSNVSMNESTITNCSNGYRGGAIYIVGTVGLPRKSLIITESSITFNSSSQFGGAIYCMELGTVRITGSIISNNSLNDIGETRGGGIYCRNLSDLIIEDSTISENSNFSDNFPCFGAGIFYDFSARLSITRSTIANNSLRVGRFGFACYGGGIYCDNIDDGLSINYSTISGNSIVSQLFTGGGGGMYYTNCALTTIYNSLIFENSAKSNDADENGGGIDIDNTPMSVVNCTISNNVAKNRGGGFYITGAGSSLSLTNCTISKNDSETSNTGVGVYSESIIPVLGNCILAGNLGQDGFISGGSPFNSQGGNVVGSGTSGFTNTNDQILSPGTDISTVLLDVANNGGLSETMALPLGSIAINNGLLANINLANFPYDQRGVGYDRSVGGMIDSGAFEYNSAIICYDGSSLVLTRNVETSEIGLIAVKKIRSNIHEVYSVRDKTFVPVRHNIVNGYVNTIYCIPKDLLGIDQPFEDFFVTAGHPIVINGNEVVSHKIEGVIELKCELQLVYSICTDERIPILINGLDVMTWSKNDWDNRPNPELVKWYDNK